jgi:MFS family permease
MDTAAPTELTWQQDLEASSRRLSAGVVGGLVAGAIVGGVVGRFAMFVLRVTSDPSLHGVKTDDGFIIGRFSTESLFLLIATAALGVLGGILYIGVRSWLPERQRAALAGVFGGIVGGALVIGPDGLDFTALDPLPLAVGMFVALPALYGVTLSLFVERLLREDSRFNRSKGWLLGLLPLLAIAASGPLGIGLLVLMFGLWAFRRWVPEAGPFVRSTAVVWTGRAILLAVTGLGLVGLVADIDQVL